MTTRPYQAALVDLQNALNAAEGDLQRFEEDGDTQAGHNLLATLEEQASALAALIRDVAAELGDHEAAATT